jgi:mRNA interferase MazF
MVEQGDIIKLSFNPHKGHEQAGYRPAVVVSNNFFNRKTNLAIVCPITNTKRPFPLHVDLDNRTQTTGAGFLRRARALF